MRSDGISIRGLTGIPEIKPGDDLARIIHSALVSGMAAPGGTGAPARPDSIFVVAQKIISKAEGSIVALEEVVPSPQALAWARQHRKDARIVEVVLREARRIVRMDRGVLIVETRHGFICANAGVDASNAPPGAVTLLPRDPDASAMRLQAALETLLGTHTAVIISDTFGRPWRQGLSNVALGVAGLSPIMDYRGQLDFCGRSLQATVLAVADELAAAAELVMGKTLGVPVALIEGYRHERAAGSGRDLIRPASEDLFR